MFGPFLIIHQNLSAALRINFIYALFGFSNTFISPEKKGFLFGDLIRFFDIFQRLSVFASSLIQLITISFLLACIFN